MRIHMNVLSWILHSGNAGIPNVKNDFRLAEPPGSTLKIDDYKLNLLGKWRFSFSVYNIRVGIKTVLS